MLFGPLAERSVVALERSRGGCQLAARVLHRGAGLVRAACDGHQGVDVPVELLDVGGDVPRQAAQCLEIRRRGGLYHARGKPLALPR